jgi:hypothetical protein
MKYTKEDKAAPLDISDDEEVIDDGIYNDFIE